MPGPVVIVPYDAGWPAVFQALRGRLAPALGPLALCIEHVGSTAVPGLAAKPIIDIDVVIADDTPLDHVVACLAPLGYGHRGDLGVPGREAFSGPADLPAHHLYVCRSSSAELRRHLAFRDHLCAHPAAAGAYAALKEALAVRFRDDREAYTRGKGNFVAAVLIAAEEPLPPGV